MIRTIRYRGKAEVEKEGKMSTVDIHPRLVLNRAGPFIEVQVTHPQVIQDHLKQEGKDIPKVSVNALLDTGASGAVIAPKVAEQLNLIKRLFLSRMNKNARFITGL